MVNRQATIEPDRIFTSAASADEGREDSLLHALLGVFVDLIEQDLNGKQLITVLTEKERIVIPQIICDVLELYTVAVIDLPEAPCDGAEFSGIFGLNDVGDIPALGWSDLSGFEIIDPHQSALTHSNLMEDAPPDLLAELFQLASSGMDGVFAHVDPSIEFFGYSNDPLSVLPCS